MPIRHGAKVAMSSSRLLELGYASGARGLAFRRRIHAVYGKDVLARSIAYGYRRCGSWTSPSNETSVFDREIALPIVALL